jgi:hypothetical protein
MPKKTILLGFEAGTGAEVKIPFHHTIVTGTTQLSGKTTTLEALVSRSNARAIAFRTKRGEADFTEAHRHAPFFKERSDWQYVQSLLEATMRERLKFERSWIIRASKNTRSLEDVHANVVRELETARGISEGVYTNLKAYLDIVLPQIRHINFATELNLVPGLNIMDLEGMSEEVQGLVIASTLEAIHKRERGVVSIVPEAWKFVPQGRHTPVQVVIEKLGREGAVIGNLVWLDSQDITGVDKPTLKNFDIWILGRQREVNEVQRTLSQIPLPKKAKPSPEDVAQLPLGHFVACFGNDVKIVYVQPAWLPAKVAADIAKDSSLLETAQEYQPKPKSPDNMESQEISELRRQLNEANQTIAELRQRPGDKEPPVQEPPAKAAAPSVSNDTATAAAPGDGVVRVGPLSFDAVERAVSITFSQEPASFETAGVRGRIMFALVHDLKNQPSREKEIITTMAERGWNHIRQTVAPELSKLVKAGYLIRNDGDATYRLPGKLILSIDGKKIQ